MYISIVSVKIFFQVVYSLILIFNFQSNEVQGSTHMELEGLKRGIAFLKNHVNIKEVVTDRHPSIKKYMRTEQEDKSHLFDVWHVAKGKNTCSISVLWKKNRYGVYLKETTSHLWNELTKNIHLEVPTLSSIQRIQYNIWSSDLDKKLQNKEWLATRSLNQSTQYYISSSDLV